MAKIQKLAIPIMFNESGDPIGLIHRSNKGDRVIYVCEKASEDQIIELMGEKLQVKSE